jgi:hypothetical protein
MMTPDEMRLLLSLAKNLNADGDVLIQETQQRYAIHVQRILEARAMWREAGERLDREEQRFGHYFPKERDNLPRVVAKGPQKQNAEG